MLNQQVKSLSIKFICFLLLMLLTVVLSSCTPEHIVISPQIDVNPPGTQHEITAKVTDAKGRPVYHSPVEWILPRSEYAVGDIVEGDDDPKTAPLIPKKTNSYAKTRTNFDGEAKITITSPFKGKTSIVAVAKGIENKDEHKAYAVKYWSYINWNFPPDATNLAGTPHRMKVQVHKPYSEAYPIRFKITKKSLKELELENFPSDLLNKLNNLKRREARTEKQEAKTEESFVDTLIKTIGEPQVTQYKPLILKHTAYIPRDDDLRNYRVEWELLANFQMTEQSIKKLREKGVPSEILKSLQRVVNHQEITGKREFLAFVAATIGKEPTHAYQSSILKYTKILIGPEAYFASNGTDLVTTETNSKGVATVTLQQILPKHGQNQIRVRLMLPNKLPEGLDQLCCPKPNDVIAQHMVEKTWVAPEISMAKCGLDGYKRVLLGETTTFDIAFANPSDFKITSVVVTDKLPPGFTFKSATPGSPALMQQPEVGAIDGTVTWALQTLPARQREVFQIKAQAVYVGTFKNTVRLTTPHSTKYFDASCTIDVVAPDLKVWKFCPPMAAVNQPFPYSYVVKNPGTEKVTNIVVRDQLPPGLIAESKEKEPTWRFGDLAPGNTIEESFNVIPQDSLLPGGAAYGGFCRLDGGWLQGHSVTNTITAEAPWVSDQGPMLLSQEQCNTCVRPEPYPALLLEVVDLYDTVKIGDTTTYKITVTNQDHADVKNVNVAVWIPEAYYAPDDDIPSLPATLDDLVKPMVSSQPKVRLLKSTQEPSPDKQPLVNRPLRAFPETMQAQMLEEMLRSMMWTALRTELSTMHRAPEALRQDVLHHHLEAEVDELKQTFLHSDSPLDKNASGHLLERYGFLRLKMLKVLREVIRKHSQRYVAPGPPIDLTQEEKNIIKALLPEEQDLPPHVRPGALQTELQKTLNQMWPGDELNMQHRWITFPTLPHLQQHWRATYYVQVQAIKSEDVRFKVIMSADEFRGPVIETESTHLID